MFSSLLPKPKHSEYDIGDKNSLFAKKSRDRIKDVVVLTDLKSGLVETGTDVGQALVHKSYDDSVIAARYNDKRKVQRSFESTVPLKTRYPNLKHHFPKPDVSDPQVQECIKETQQVIDKLLREKLGQDEKSSKDSVSFVKFTSQTYNAADERGREKVVQIRDIQEDPMLPPKFKLRKNRHKEPSPPPPILKKAAPTNSVTKEEREKWRIPAAISNWKNNEGFTISIDKRMKAAGSGSSLSEADLNVEKFGELSEALETADKNAREEIKIRNEMMKEVALKEKIQKEQQLRELAEFTRNERYGQKRSYNDYSQQKRSKY